MGKERVGMGWDGLGGGVEEVGWCMYVCIEVLVSVGFRICGL